MFMFLILSGAGIATVALAYGLGYERGEVAGWAGMKAKVAAEDVEAATGDEDEDDDVCLRVGMRVICRLSPESHTHGTILGFAMNQHLEGPMLAVVNVSDGAPPMPIDVDLVEPVGDGPAPKPPGYRDNAKHWN